MGACCVSRDSFDRDSDLPPFDFTNFKGDEYQKFELSLPFHQTYIDAFDRRVRNAARITAGAKPLEAGEVEKYEEGKANQ